ncbi:hypothetical protein DSM104443_00509 [Usitatibacter rugosus]|uniref:Arabinofuranosyltransferase n=1 Tax=Usitatibacter rugosus TaxID=2732067 RepID=A0A6M4GQY0_9PROT|nr:hypothetical protein [Usitatibacter rugosus]QJR09465.1 hypothetical protein DSM104443_00509 [Usitatibacter rugosus]
MKMRFEVQAAGVALAAVAAMAFLRAWLSDDGFITFRVVEQMAHGNGPVYNIGERVQVFTHPLWFFALAGWNGLGGSLYPGTMYFSLLVFAAGLAAFTVAFRDRPATLAAVLLAMFFSRAAMDYATSGLETPLSFALAMTAAFAIRRGHVPLAIAALALLPLNRLDLAAYALPFALVVPVASWRGRAGVVVAMMAPAVAWALFSFVYYGSPVPNTALAKLSDGLAGRIDQGLSYVVASLLTDPGTFALIATGFVLGVMRRHEPLARAGLAAIVLTLGYTVWAGGDFMLGRFVLPATWASMIVIAAALPGAWRENRRALASLVGVLAIAHAVSGHTTLITHLGQQPHTAPLPHYRGALDERFFYLPHFGLFATAPARKLDYDEIPPSKTDPELANAVGAHAYFRPLERAIADTWALADPLLARIRPLPNGRPGHGYRPVPPQWWRWREPGFHLGDKHLDAIAGDLRLAHRSPDLFSTERFAAIARLLRERNVRYTAIDFEPSAEWVDIAIRPRRLDRRAEPSGEPVAWVTRDCQPEYPRYENGYLIAVDPQGVAHVRCPAKDFNAAPFGLRAGSFRADRPGELAFLDEMIAVVRPKGGWVRDIPAWAFSGWREDPLPALVVSLLLATLSGFLLVERKQ